MGENHMPQFVCECIQWYDSIIPQGIFVNLREKKNSNRIPNSLQKPALHIHHMMTNNSESQQWSLNPQQKTIHNHLTFMPNFMQK